MLKIAHINCNVIQVIYVCLAETLLHLSEAPFGGIVQRDLLFLVMVSLAMRIIWNLCKTANHKAQEKVSPKHLPTAVTQPNSQSYHIISYHQTCVFIIMSLNNVIVRFHFITSQTNSKMNLKTMMSHPTNLDVLGMYISCTLLQFNWPCWRYILYQLGIYN